MTTSPSWFDQEKFSSLVKKVGVKTAGPAPAASPFLRVEAPVVARPVETPAVPSPANDEALRDLKDELARTVSERDSARREYGNLREDFETLQQEAARLRETGSSPENGLGDGNWESEKAEFMAQAAQRDEEIAALQINTIGMQDVIETFKQEMSILQEQILQANETVEVMRQEIEASQKQTMEAQAAEEDARQELEASRREAQEARDALNAKTETSSLSQTNLDNLKNECSSLVQQNMFLQAQHDQLARELSAVKAKAAAKSESGPAKPLRA